MASLAFQNVIFFCGLDALRPNLVQMLYSHFRNPCMFGNTCLEAKRVGAHLMDQLKKEMCHLKAEKNKSFWIFTEPDTISLFCLLMNMYFLFILLPHLVLIMYVPIL